GADGALRRVADTGLEILLAPASRAGKDGTSRQQMGKTT
ncbi:hypothetical protein A2U01_0117888, partial [Trifolium medium]|nr:hypothetical protein [Trifolium medium]